MSSTETEALIRNKARDFARDIRRFKATQVLFMKAIKAGTDSGLTESQIDKLVSQGAATQEDRDALNNFLDALQSAKVKGRL